MSHKGVLGAALLAMAAWAASCSSVVVENAGSGGASASATTGSASMSSSASGCSGTLCGGQCLDTQGDPHNCGACGHDCLGATCTGGACDSFVVATGQYNAFRIAVDESYVYWTTRNMLGKKMGTVMKAPIAGGASVMIAGGEDDPTGIAVNQTDIYWIDYLGDTIRTAPKAGGTPVTLASGGVATSILVDASSAYFWLSGGIMKLPLAGGTPVQLADSIYAFGCAVDATNVYWTEVDAAVVRKVPIAGGPAVTLANVKPSIVSKIVAGASDVFFTLQSGKLYSLPIGGGNPTLIDDGDELSHGELAVDAERVYWATYKEIRAVPIAGGPATILYQTPSFAMISLAVDSTRIYWVQESGDVRWVAK
jgi:hypothetical protein